MNVLVAIGAFAAFAYSLIGTLMGQGEQYLFYETAATIMMDSKVMAIQESAVSNKPARVTGQWCAASMVDLIVCWIASVCTSRSSRGNF